MDSDRLPYVNKRMLNPHLLSKLDWHPMTWRALIHQVRHQMHF